MKKFIFILLSILVSSSFISCSEDEADLQILKEKKVNEFNLNAETLDFKNSLIDEINSQKTKSMNKDFALNNDQINKLNKKCMKMLASHGFRPSEFRELINEGDTRLILFTALFTGVLEGEPIISNPITKTSEEADDDNTCWSYDRVVGCAVSAGLVIPGLSINNIHDAFKTIANCVTKSGAKTALKVIVKNIPIAKVIVFIPAFTNCMGWTDFLSNFL